MLWYGGKPVTIVRNKFWDGWFTLVTSQEINDKQHHNAQKAQIILFLQNVQCYL